MEKDRTPLNKLDHDQIFLIYLNEYFGQKIQMVASQHIWFRVTKMFLHLAIDVDKRC